MPRFSANLSTMFREYPPLDRPAAARAAGFACIEIQFPYDLPLDALAGRVGDLGLAVSVINIPAGDFMAGGAGIAAVPGREAEFHAAVATALPYAAALGALNVNVLAGAPDVTPGATDRPAYEREDCLDALAANLRHAADAFAAIGVTVVVEPVNTVDRPGFLLPHTADAAAILDRAGRPNLAIQFDLYHAAMMGEPLLDSLATHRPRIGHIQFSDAPGRHEPGTGTIDFAALFAAIDRSDYAGWTAAEYFPEGRTEDSLGWRARRAGQTG